MVATPTKEANVYVRALVTFIGIFGSPLFIRTDQGGQFTAEVCKQAHEILGIYHLPIIAYHPQANGIVERRNAEVMKHLRALVSTRGLAGDWSLMLPLAQRILNATSDSSIGRAPMEIIFGNMLPNSDPFIFEYVDGEPLDADLIEPYLAQLISNQGKLIETSRKFLETAEFKQPVVKHDPSTIVRFAVGDIVLAKWKGSEKAPNKLSSKYEGPLEIVSLVRDDMLEAKHMATGDI